MSDNKETFGNFLLRRFHEWSGRELGRSGRIPSQAEWATNYLKVKTSTLSTWVNDQKVPTGDSVDKLADKLGPEVYDLLGLPRRMPRDKKLNFIASVWTRLPEHLQDEWYEIARNATQGEEGGGNAHQRA